MARVKTKNTSPEITVRSMLHRLGYRFRLHKKDLPGSPDIVLASHQKVIFVHGCFWHGHSCKRGELPASNRIFWETKIARNQSRDLSTARKLRDAGWSVSTVWECQTKDTAKLENRLAKLMTK